MVRKWISDIKEKTAHMDRRQTAEYIAAYYWFHILLTAIALGLLLLLAYHIGWGRRKPDFTVALVNQQADSEQDQALAQRFSAASGISLKKIFVDSDYLLSYDDVQLKNIKESSYEKFFFNWSAGALDAVVMPESFYRHCREMGGEFTDVRSLPHGETLPASPELLFMDAGKCAGIYAEKTALQIRSKTDGDDPLLLVFPASSKRQKAAGKFIQFALTD